MLLRDGALATPGAPADRMHRIPCGNGAFNLAAHAVALCLCPLLWTNAFADAFASSGVNALVATQHFCSRFAALTALGSILDRCRAQIWLVEYTCWTAAEGTAQPGRDLVALLTNATLLNTGTAS